jgi:hypothetical protein
LNYACSLRDSITVFYVCFQKSFDYILRLGSVLPSSLHSKLPNLAKMSFCCSKKIIEQNMTSRSLLWVNPEALKHGEPKLGCNRTRAFDFTRIKDYPWALLHFSIESHIYYVSFHKPTMRYMRLKCLKKLQGNPHR